MDYKQIQTELLCNHHLSSAVPVKRMDILRDFRGSHGPGFAKELSSNMSGRVAGQIVPDVW